MSVIYYDCETGHLSIVENGRLRNIGIYPCEQIKVIDAAKVDIQDGGKRIVCTTTLTKPSPDNV